MLRAQEPDEPLQPRVRLHKLAGPADQPMPRASWGGWPGPSGGAPSQADRCLQNPGNPPPNAPKARQIDERQQDARTHAAGRARARTPHVAPGGPTSFGSHHGNISTSGVAPATEKSRYSRAAREERDRLRVTLAAGLTCIGADAQSVAVRQCEVREYLTDATPGAGHGAPIMRQVEGAAWKPVIRARYCDHRLCPWCCWGRSKRYADKLAPAVAQHFRAKPALATFTIDDRSGESLQSAAGRILGAYAKLQRRKQWRAAVRGGLRSFEVTRNAATRSWHVHLHVLLDTDYFPQDELLALWRECLTGDPEGWVRVRGHEPRRVGGVNIKRVDDVMEACKYVAKGNEALATWPKADLLELLAWMRGRRLLQTFGCLHGIKVNEDEQPHEEEAPPETGINGRTGEVRTAEDCAWSRAPSVEDEAWALLQAAHAERRSQWDGG